MHRVDEQLAKGLDRKVWLPSGGSLVIDRTEAMAVIDVNTGKFIGSGRQPRGDGHQQQPRGGRGDRPPAAAARPRRHHRHRLHRHGPGVQPRPGAAPAAGVPGPGPDQAPGGRGHLAGADPDDPQARRPGPAGGVLRDRDSATAAACGAHGAGAAPGTPRTPAGPRLGRRRRAARPAPRAPERPGTSTRRPRPAQARSRTATPTASAFRPAVRRGRRPERAASPTASRRAPAGHRAGAAARRRTPTAGRPAEPSTCPSQHVSAREHECPWRPRSTATTCSRPSQAEAARARAAGDAQASHRAPPGKDASPSVLQAESEA